MADSSPVPGAPRPLWQVEARKYDRSLHYVLPAYLVEDDGERVWLRQQVGGLLRHITRGWARPLNTQSELFFWRERWYNIYLNHPHDGAPRHFYCNVTLPPTVVGSTLSFVDLDLDVRIWPERGFELLDLDEFREHTLTYGYPPETQRAAYQAMLDILLLWRAREFPFDQ